MDSGATNESAHAVELAEDDGRLALAIDGAVQSVAVGGGAAPCGYWPAMLPDHTPRDALLLGLGGGTIAHLLTGTYGPLPILGVDDDPAVLALGRAHFGLDLPNLEILIADAFAFAADCSRQFDLICVDLFRDGQIPARVGAPGFLRELRRLLRPGGTLTFNLARDRRATNRLAQIGRHFVVVKRILVGFNLVVHATSESAPTSDYPLRPTRRGQRAAARQERRDHGRAARRPHHPAIRPAD